MSKNLFHCPLKRYLPLLNREASYFKELFIDQKPIQIIDPTAARSVKKAKLSCCNSETYCAQVYLDEYNVKHIVFAGIEEVGYSGVNQEVVYNLVILGKQLYSLALMKRISVDPELLTLKIS